MFHRLKLKQYLIRVFSIMILLLIVNSLFGIYNMNLIKSNDAQYRVRAELSMKIDENLSEINRLGRVLRDAYIDDNFSYNEIVYLTEEMEQIETGLHDILGIYQENDMDTRLLQMCMNQFYIWENTAFEIIEYLENGETEKAGLALINYCTPAINALEEYGLAIDDEIDLILRELTQKNDILVTITTVVSIILAILSVIVCLFIIHKILKNIIPILYEIKNVLGRLEHGELDIEISYTGDNEFGDLSQTINVTLKQLKKYVDNVAESMNAFSKNDFSFDIPRDFKGDFIEVSRSLEDFEKNMRTTLRELGDITQEVSIGVEQFAMSAQTLAFGAIKQADSVKVLNKSIQSISVQVLDTTRNAQSANSLGQDSRSIIDQSTKEIGEMKLAIHSIVKSTQDIKKIISTLSEIAEQTNLLALNAAIEAARAGEAGSGFAVVAKEIRELANKSNESAHEVENLIKNTLVSVQEGTIIVDSTILSFNNLVNNVNNIVTYVEGISKASKEIATSIEDASNNVELISKVVENTSTTTQTSAATSEEINAQSMTMADLVGQFKI
ncbi:MAG: hypothetical protein ATN36_04985 [Epulopiscium sp. Nele67-Bin005]|nr:MAG: hypothetical protein ATN36_04985 [Epulopiscium sp. Nele67-Bin005]